MWRIPLLEIRLLQYLLSFKILQAVNLKYPLLVWEGKFMLLNLYPEEKKEKKKKIHLTLSYAVIF